MKKLLTTLLVMVFLGTVFTGAVFAQGPGSMMSSSNYQPRYDGDQREYGVGYNRIELSEEQINEIADLREEFYNETEELRDQMRDLNREIRDLEFRGASYAEIGEVEDEIEAVLVQMDEKRIAHQEKIESVLTEEQLAAIEENRLNYEDRFQGRYNNEFGPGHHMGYGRRSFSNRGFGHHGFDGHGYGMMGRGFNGRGIDDSFRSGRGFGYGAGFCH